MQAGSGVGGRKGVGEVVLNFIPVDAMLLSLLASIIRDEERDVDGDRVSVSVPVSLTALVAEGVTACDGVVPDVDTRISVDIDEVASDCSTVSVGSTLVFVGMVVGSSTTDIPVADGSTGISDDVNGFLLREGDTCASLVSEICGKA